MTRRIASGRGAARGAGRGAASMVTVRMAPQSKAALHEAARRVGLRPSRLAALLVEYGVCELAQANPIFERVVKGTRDASRGKRVRPL